MSDDTAKIFGTLYEFWATQSTPARIDSDAFVPAQWPPRIVPSPHGSIFRFVRIEPESSFAHLSEAERRESTRKAFARIGSEDALSDTAKHAAMHKTVTVDYIVVLSGRVTMILDDGEVDLQPRDVVIQRGTNHAWVNKHEEEAFLCAVLLDARGEER